MHGNLVELGGDIRFKIWVTRGWYFILYDRLRRKARYSNASITMLSFYLVIVAIIQMGFHDKISKTAQEYIAPASIILSVFIIIVSLLEQSNEYRLEADLSLRTAQRLEALFNRYETHALGLKNADEAELRKEYAEILVEAKTHRKSIDYQQFQLENANAFPTSRLGRTILKMQFAASVILEYWLYHAMIIIPPVIFLAVYFTGMK